MKNLKLLLSVVILLGTFGVTMAAQADDPGISRDQFEAGSYCHEKFPAVTGRSLASDSTPRVSVSDFNITVRPI